MFFVILLVTIARMPAFEIAPPEAFPLALVAFESVTVEEFSVTSPCKIEMAPPFTSAPLEIIFEMAVLLIFTTPSSTRNAAPPAVEKPPVSVSPSNVASVFSPRTEKMEDLPSPLIVTFFGARDCDIIRNRGKAREQLDRAPFGKGDGVGAGRNIRLLDGIAQTMPSPLS